MNSVADGWDVQRPRGGQLRFLVQSHDFPFEENRDLILAEAELRKDAHLSNNEADKRREFGPVVLHDATNNARSIGKEYLRESLTSSFSFIVTSVAF